MQPKHLIRHALKINASALNPTQALLTVLYRCASILSQLILPLPFATCSTKLQQQPLCYSYGVSVETKSRADIQYFSRDSAIITYTQKRRKDTKHATKKDSRKNIRLRGKGEGGPPPSLPPYTAMRKCTIQKKTHTHAHKYTTGRMHSLYYSVSPSCIAAASPRSARKTVTFSLHGFLFYQNKDPLIIVSCRA